MRVKMNKALLIGVITIIFLLSGCKKATSINIEENSPSHITNSTTGINLVEEINSQSSNQHSNDQEVIEMKLSMKIFVNFGMEEEYDVLDMDDETVTYNYYNYENADAPKLDQKTTKFDEIMKVEQDTRVYLFYMYLDNGSNEIMLDMSEDFIEELENDPNFRMQLGRALNKPFTKELTNNTITALDIQ